MQSEANFKAFNAILDAEGTIIRPLAKNMEALVLAILIISSLATALNLNTFQAVLAQKPWLSSRDTTNFKTSSISLCAIHAAKIDRNLPFGTEQSGHCQVVIGNPSKDNQPIRLSEKNANSAHMYTTKDRADNGEKSEHFL